MKDGFPKQRGAGRKTGFSLKMLEGRSSLEAAILAAHGEAAMTEGARLVRKYLFFREINRSSGGLFEKDFAKSEHIMRETFEQALTHANPGPFLEVASYFENVQRAEAQGGALSKGMAQASAFVNFCKHWRKGREFRYSGPGPHPASLETARVKAPFTPTPSELYDYLCECCDPPGDAPDRKTSDRYARALGLPFKTKKK